MTEPKREPDDLPAPRNLDDMYSEWMLRSTTDPSMKPGDVVIFGFDYPPTGDPVARYGHVEVITKQQARHYRRQTLLARLRVLFGGKP